MKFVIITYQNMVVYHFKILNMFVYGVTINVFNLMSNYGLKSKIILNQYYIVHLLANIFQSI